MPRPVGIVDCTGHAIPETLLVRPLSDTAITVQQLHRSPPRRHARATQGGRKSRLGCDRQCAPRMALLSLHARRLRRKAEARQPEYETNKVTIAIGFPIQVPDKACSDHSVHSEKKRKGKKRQNSPPGQPTKSRLAARLSVKCFPCMD